jgi:hypothetical protein
MSGVLRAAPKWRTFANEEPCDRSGLRWRAGALALGGGVTPASATPAAGANLLTQTQDIQQNMSGAILVQRRHRYQGGGYRGPRHAGRYYGRRHGYRRDRFGRYAPWIGLGIIGGLAAGAASQGAYAAPAGDAYALCAQQFRSFNPSTGTYTTYGGETRLCPYLR